MGGMGVFSIAMLVIGMVKGGQCERALSWKFQNLVLG
jgi:hypothetical protein